MSQATQNSAPQAVTKQYDFYAATPGGDKLFSVREGIPLDYAFDELSLLISQGTSVVATLCEGESPDAAPGAARLLDFAHALVQAMHNGFTKAQSVVSGPRPPPMGAEPAAPPLQ